MMGWYFDESYAGFDLSPEQRQKIAEIWQRTAKGQWQLMGSMHQQGYHMYGVSGPGAPDEAAARKAFQSMSDTQKAMFEIRLEARKQVDAVLTKEQREQWHRYWDNR